MHFTEGPPTSDGAPYDLASVLRKLETLTSVLQEEVPVPQLEEVLGQTGPASATEDLVRYFLRSHAMVATLHAFESEWQGVVAKGEQNDTVRARLSELYSTNIQLQKQFETSEAALDNARAAAARLSSAVKSCHQERDTLRRQLGRTAQEKQKLLGELGKLRQQCLVYEPVMVKLQQKCESALRERMVVTLRCERLAHQLEMQGELPASVGAPAQPRASRDLPPAAPTTPNRAAQQIGSVRHDPIDPDASAGGATLPVKAAQNPFLGRKLQPPDMQAFALTASWEAHSAAASNVAVHPSKPVAATVSDDRTWKLWHLPTGDLIMAGDGHKDWVAGLDFNPQGTHLATGSGDATVKLWSFEEAICTATLTEHHQAVWGVAWHHTADFVASCSLDHSARLWDITTECCRQSYRSHTDSVNGVCWQPYSSMLVTCSSDKSIIIWDSHSGQCIQALTGHQNSCTSVTFSKDGTTLASTDADGVVYLWDIKTGTRRAKWETGRVPANKCTFDSSGDILIVCSDAKVLVCIDATGREGTVSLTGHAAPVHAAAWDAECKALVSVSVDGVCNVWS